jgi:HEAT repeat protein
MTPPDASPSVPVLRAQLHAADLPVREPAVRALASIGTPEALHPLFKLLHEAGPGTRATVLGAIAGSERVPTDALLSELDSRLQVEDEDAAERARLLAEILSIRGVDRGSEVLLDDFCCQTVVEGFIARGPDGVRALCRTLAGLDPFTQQLIVQWTAARRRKVEATVYELIDDPSPERVAGAVTVLGGWDDPRSVETLLRVARDGTRPRAIRDAALDSLCDLQAPEAIETLCAAMVDAEVEATTREACVGALGSIGNHAALPALEAMVAKGEGRTLERLARGAIERIRG